MRHCTVIQRSLDVQLLCKRQYVIVLHMYTRRRICMLAFMSCRAVRSAESWSSHVRIHLESMSFTCSHTPSDTCRRVHSALRSTGSSGSAHVDAADHLPPFVIHETVCALIVCFGCKRSNDTSLLLEISAPFSSVRGSEGEPSSASEENISSASLIFLLACASLRLFPPFGFGLLLWETTALSLCFPWCVFCSSCDDRSCVTRLRKRSTSEDAACCIPRSVCALIGVCALSDCSLRSVSSSWAMMCSMCVEWSWTAMWLRVCIYVCMYVCTHTNECLCISMWIYVTQDHVRKFEFE